MPAPTDARPPAEPVALTQYRNSSPIAHRITRRQGARPHRLFAAEIHGGRAVVTRTTPLAVRNIRAFRVATAE